MGEKRKKEKSGVGGGGAEKEENEPLSIRVTLLKKTTLGFVLVFFCHVNITIQSL
jgi:hypothetical protein